MSLALAVAKRELFGKQRERLARNARVGVAIAAGVVLLVGFVIGLGGAASAIGGTIFGYVVHVMFVAWLAAAWSAASLIAREVEGRTLGLLFIAGVSPSQVVLGKLTQALLTALTMILAILPMMILCVGLGGVSTDQVLRGMVIGVSAVFMASCLGIAVSSLHRTEKTAVAVSVVVSLILIGGVPGLAALFDPARGEYLDVVTRAVSPSLALEDVVMDSPNTSVASNVMFNVCLALLCLLVAFVRVPRLLIGEERFESLRETFRRSRVENSGNPMLWRERIMPMRLTTKVLICLLALTIVATLTANLPDRGGFHTFTGYFAGGDTVLSIILVTCLAGGLIAGIGILTDCAVSFGRDKRRRTIDLLLVTGLTESELIMGKLWACVAVWAPWLVVVVGLAASTMFYQDVSVWHFLAAVGVFFSVILGIAATGLYFSLRLGTVAAISVSAFCGVPWLFLSGGAILSDEGMGMLVMIVLNLIGAHISLGKLSYRLRQISAGERTWA